MAVGLLAAAAFCLAPQTTALAQFGVSVRTRDGGGTAADRIRIETGVNNASVRFSNAFLQVDAIPLPAVSLAGTGRIAFDGAQFLVSENGGAYTPLIGAGGGITSLNAQVGAVQTFANDVNVTIASAGNVHTLGWLGQLSAARGGLGIDSSAAADGSVLRRSAGAWELLAPGAAGQVLTMSGGLPAWAVAPGGGVTTVNGENGPAVTMTAAGTAGLSVAVSGPDTIQYSLADVWVNTAGDTMTGVLNLPAAGLTIGGSALQLSNPGSNLVHWDNIAGMPAGFADGTDAVDGGNANLLDGLDSLSFLRSDAADNYTSGTMTFDLPTTLNVLGTFQLGGQAVNVSDGSAPNVGSNLVSWNNLTDVPLGFSDGSDDGAGGGITSINAEIGPVMTLTSAGTAGLTVAVSAPNTIQYSLADVWVNTAGDTMTGLLTMNTAGGADAVLSESGIDLSNAGPVTFNIQNSGLGAMTLQVDGSSVWHAGNDGAGSTLDADLLDGVNSLSFLRSDASDNYTSGTMTFDLATTLNVLGTFQLSGQAVNVSDGSAPNLGSNLISWNNLTDVPLGFSDGSDDGAGGGITTLNGLGGAIQTFTTNTGVGTTPTWNSAGTNHELQIPMASAGGVTAGLLSNADYVAFAGSVDGVLATPPITSTGGQTPTIGLNIGAGLGVAGGALVNTGDTNAADDITTATAAGGDLTGTYPSPTVDGLQGNAVSAAAPALNDVLKWNGANWAPATDATGGGVPAPGIAGQILYDNGAAWVALAPGTAGQVLTMVGGLPQWATPSGGSSWFTITAGTPGGSWGTGTLNPEDPYNCWYHDSRAQFVVLASELTAAGMSAGNITGLRLKCFETPGQDLTDFRIRIQATAATTATSFTPGGWTLVYGPTTITAASLTPAAWNDYIFTTAFNWDGTSNLLIDLTRDNTSFTSNGGMYVQTGLTNRMYAGYNDSVPAWPFDTGLFEEQQNTIPELQLQGSGGGGGGGTNTWTSNPAAAITDFVNTIDNIVVAGAPGTIVDVNVLVNITHTWAGDLQIYVTPPSGVEYQLQNQFGGAADDVIGTYDDAGSTGTNIETTFQVNLTTMEGGTANGTWQIRILDNAGGDSGTLNSWSVTINYSG